MKKNAIMLADTRVALVGQMLIQLSHTNQDVFDEVIIIDIGLTEQEKRIMDSIMPCRFLQYQSPISKDLLHMEKFQRFSLIMFARYEMFRLLSEYALIMWIDTDVVIRGSLQPLLNETVGYGFSILREDPENKSSKNVDYMRTNFFHAVPEYRMDSYLYCTGMIIVRDCLEQQCDYTKWCYDKTVEWVDNLNLPDQGVINALIQEFGFPVKPIGHGGKYGCYPYVGRDCRDAVVVHTWGSNKFWNNWYLNQTFPEWEECYQEWLKSGGTPLVRSPIPEVSVVIPVYKPDMGYFRQCLDSLMEQQLNDFEEYSNFEVVIISEPENRKEVEEHIASYHDLRLRLYFNEQRVGIAASLNRGFREARGVYIARLDDDDIAAPTRLQEQAKYLKEHPEISLCTSDYFYFGDMNDGRVALEGEMARAWSVLTCPFDHPTIMLRRDFFIGNNLFYDESRGYVEDWELWQRAFQKGMKVGCIHNILLYHRWHNGSAGQSDKTVEMMQEMVQTNFRQLQVEISKEDLRLLGPWNGKVESEADYCKLEGYFRAAINNNARMGLYDSLCLAHVFSLRLSEARSGIIPELVIYRSAEEDRAKAAVGLEQRNQKQNRFKVFIKKILKPFYRPFRHRYEDRIIAIQQSGWAVEGHVLNCIAKLDQIIAVHQQQIEQMRQELIQTRTQMEALLSKQTVEIQEQLSAKIFVEVENIRQELSAKLFTEAENTRQELSAKLFTEAENTRQELSAKLFTEAENTRQELAAKLFTEAENTRTFTENRIWKTECDLSGKISEIDQTKRLLDETHRHIDFTYHDLMVALQRQRGFLPENKIKLETDYPIAYESLDHLYPHGTIQDNTRYPRFVKKCETLLASRKELAFLDLGCSGGGMVLEAALRGHISMGLEGSDCSKREQRAEWRLLGDRLQTCDITKPFYLRDVDKKTQQFDVITAWEVLEHIAETDLPGLFDNIRNHLADDGIFVGSIANWDDIDPEGGVNWHVTVHPYDWWKAKFEAAGFFVCTELFDVIDLARGGYNPPHCYEAPYPDVDTQKSFHIAVRKTDA